MGEWEACQFLAGESRVAYSDTKGSKRSQPRTANRRCCFLQRVDKLWLSPLQDTECQKGIASPEKYLHTHRAIY